MKTGSSILCQQLSCTKHYTVGSTTTASYITLLVPCIQRHHLHVILVMHKLSLNKLNHTINAYKWLTSFGASAMT